MKMSYSHKLTNRNPADSEGTNHQVPLATNDHDVIGGKKLLVVCHSYNSFQKDTTESLSGRFKEINVLVRTNRIAELSNSLHVPQLERFNRAYKIDLMCKPHDVNVFPTPLWYLPGNKAYRSLGDGHYCIVKDAIEKNSQKFDIIHSHFTWSAGYVGARLKEEYSVPFVVTGHGYDIYSLPFKDDEWREKIKWVLNTADHIITVSKSNLACIQKLDVSTPTTVIPNGFKSDLFYPRSSVECRKILNLPQRKNIILTVGNLASVKGQRYLVDAMKEVIQERKDVVCVIIGTGKLHNVLYRQIRSLGLENHIMLAGGKPHHDIPTWMNACDLFVLPSLNEGNPTVMFEALGCGKPFLGTKVGGVPEVITSSDYGLLAEPGDTEDLAEKILIGLKRDWDLGNINQYAEQYSWENISKNIIEIYNEVLKKNQP